MPRSSRRHRVETVDRFGEGVAQESSTLLTEGSIPASPRCSVYLIERHWTPGSHIMDEAAAAGGPSVMERLFGASRTKLACAVLLALQ